MDFEPGIPRKCECNLAALSFSSPFFVKLPAFELSYNMLEEVEICEVHAAYLKLWVGKKEEPPRAGDTPEEAEDMLNEITNIALEEVKDLAGKERRRLAFEERTRLALEGMANGLDDARTTSIRLAMEKMASEEIANTSGETTDEEKLVRLATEVMALEDRAEALGETTDKEQTIRLATEMMALEDRAKSLGATTNKEQMIRLQWERW